LFRALVLMGGGLALSCGGVARGEPDPTPLSSAGSSGASGGTVAPGSGGATVITPPGPVITIGGGTSTVDAGVPVPLACPPEQYDCDLSTLNFCVLDLNSALAAGACVCNPSRPKSVKDCKPNENLVCMIASLDGAPLTTWDGSVNAQCSCIPSPIPATYNDCYSTCEKAFPEVNPNWARCVLPNPCTYDASGACTATPADVLYQDGILCGGCANIGLK